MMMRSLIVAALFAMMLTVGCQHGRSIEQAAFTDFLNNHWGPQIFTDECTGLSFDPEVPLTVFTTSPGYSVSLLDLAALAPIDVRSAALQEGGLDRLAGEAIEERITNLVPIQDYPTTRLAESNEPKDNWKPADGYLLRFSNRVRFENRTYLQIWVKAGRSSSGARIDYEFDESGRLIRSKKQSPRCDDWG